VVEAMSSHWPYRPALGVENALKEISQNKGILYDPEVVRAYLSLFNEKKFKFKIVKGTAARVKKNMSSLINIIQHEALNISFKLGYQLP